MVFIHVIVESVWTAWINVVLVTEIAAVYVRLLQLCHPLVLVSRKSVSLLLLSKFLGEWISSGF